LNVLEKNLNALGKRYPQYIEAIKRVGFTGRYSAVNTPGKTPNLVDMVNKQPYYNSLDPLAGAAGDLERRNIRLSHLTVFLGLGLGYHAIAHINSNQGAVECVIIFEHEPEAIKTALSVLDLTPLINHPKVILCFILPPPNFFPILFAGLQQGNTKFYLKAINIIELEPAIGKNMQYYSACVKVLRDGVSAALMHFGNAPDDSLVGIRNTFRNINTIIDYDGIIKLKDAFKNKPGIVVATGPSLNKNIDLLAGLEDKAVIVAADASLKVMLEKGYRPHLVTSLERGLPTAKLFEFTTEESLKDIYLSACPVVDPATYEAYPGEKIIVYRPFATFKWLELEKGTIDTGPSSGNMAFSVLAYLGCNPIILIGQDLSFEEGRTHADGTTYGSRVESYMQQQNLVLVPGNYITHVTTSKIFQYFLQYYENQIAQYSGKAINATEGGARILGTELLTFKEAIERHISKPINTLAVIKRRVSPTKSAKSASIREKVRGILADGLDFSQKVIDALSEGAEKANDILLTSYKPYAEGDQSKLEPLDNYEEILKKPYTFFADNKFFLVLMHYVQAYLINNITEINKLKAENDPSPELSARVLAINIQMFLNLIKLIEIFKAELSVALEILDNRINEDNKI
jgi:hypothetical protein